MPLFDGGRRKGDLAHARAAYEANVDDYCQLVPVAFREVEDNLSELRILQDQTLAQAEEVKASTRAAQLPRTQYPEGAAMTTAEQKLARIGRGAGLRARPDQLMVMPPSTLRIWPVINEAASDAMKTIASACSSDTPRRAIGTCVTRAALFSGV
jgi:hypothetical protein